MRKSILFFASAMLALAVSFTSCGDKADADRKVEKLVEYMQADGFREEIAGTELFTGSEVTVNDSVVELTLNTIEGIRINALPTQLLAAQQEGLRQTLIQNYRQALPEDKICREGFEGLRDKNMALKITLRDTQGNCASAKIEPKEVLSPDAI